MKSQIVAAVVYQEHSAAVRHVWISAFIRLRNNCSAELEQCLDSIGGCYREMRLAAKARRWVRRISGHSRVTRNSEHFGKAAIKKASRSDELQELIDNEYSLSDLKL